MAFTFTAVYQEAEEGGYIGFVEELPGAITQGETLEETRENLQDAIALVLEGNRILAEEALKGQKAIREPILLQPVSGLRIGSVVIRCYEFDRMRAFWQEALHYVPRAAATGGWVILRDPQGRGPNVSLDQAPEKRTGKRSSLHLDLYTDDQAGEVERLIQIGAKRYPWRYRPGDDFVVLEDPDGNLFCVVQVRGDA